MFLLFLIILRNVVSTKIPVDYTAIGLRQYFTKGSCFENMVDDKFEEVMNKFNHRPRKTLNYKILMQYFFAEHLQEAAWQEFRNINLDFRIYDLNCYGQNTALQNAYDVLPDSVLKQVS